jgi:hypothetical protein
MRVDVLWTAPFKVHKSDNHSLIQKAYKGKKLLIRVWYYFGVLGPFLEPNEHFELHFELLGLPP